ncbi:MAG TPA: DUF805 domain-containing protein [Gammaproteobacteria bacterium]|nr:DUF805 domain-containing protein [Gammaproteobacteria bacterium]
MSNIFCELLSPFRGRASIIGLVVVYGLGFLGVFVVLLITLLIEEAMGIPFDELGWTIVPAALVLIYWLFLLLFTGVRRLHDTNHSGWYLLIIPYALYLFFVEGDSGANDYGDSPSQDE